MSAPALVIDNDITFRGTGVPAQPTPSDAFDDLAVFLARVSRTFGKHENDGGTVLIGPDNLAALGFPPVPPAKLAEAEVHPALAPARNVGWKIHHAGPWMTFHRPQSPTVHMGVLPWLDSENFELIDSDPVVMADRMDHVARLLRTPYRARPGITATAALRQFVGGRAPYWKPDNWAQIGPVGPYEERVAWEEPYTWRSPLEDSLTQNQRYLHGYDVRLQFLAAASAVMLPRNALSHTKKRRYDGSAGYWKIIVPPWNIPGLPHPCGTRCEAGDIIAVTHPTMNLLQTLSDDYNVIAMPEILDSWTAQNRKEPGAEKPVRLLRDWSEVIRDAVLAARREGDPIIAEAMKSCYTHGIVHWLKPWSSCHRPDWVHAIHALARCLFFMKLFQQWRVDGRTPVKIFHDTAYYASTIADPEWDRPSTFVPSLFMGRLNYSKSEEL